MNNLRSQKDGKQRPWTKEEIAAGLQHFFDTHNRYPIAHEVDAYPYLPSARSIERSFGGLVKVREELGLESQTDFRNGAHSSNRANRINKRSHETEAKVYEFLCTKFGKEFVHREYFFTDDRRTRADFFVYDKHGGFCVDIFYPESRRNLTGCLNSKLQKYTSEYMRQYPVFFLQMNEALEQGTLDELVKNKTKPLEKGQRLVGWDTFQEFCNVREPLQIK